MDDARQTRHIIITKLIESGAAVDYCKPTTGMTALHWLAYNNDARAIKVLLKYGADSLAFNN